MMSRVEGVLDGGRKGGASSSRGVRSELGKAACDVPVSI